MNPQLKHAALTALGNALRSDQRPAFLPTGTPQQAFPTKSGDQVAFFSLLNQQYRNIAIGNHALCHAAHQRPANQPVATRPHD